MSRTRRRIESCKAYELCFRARRGLPLVAYRVIRQIIEHVLARAQRDEKVYLCHDIWNGSHSHVIVMTKDSHKCTQFYGEVQKNITDCLKRLLGLDHLSIWEGHATVIKLGDLGHAIDRIAYLYANPAKDNLETCIERFPGYSSYAEFLECQDGKLDSITKKEVTHIRLPTIPTVRSGTLTQLQDIGLVKLIERRNEETQALVRYPNIWMKAFGVTEDKVHEINQQIIQSFRTKEELAEVTRQQEGKSVMGRARLMQQPIMKPHTPKKKNRKIYYLGLCKEKRLQEILDFKYFCKLCRECYLAWKRGNFSVIWPPGAFKPPMPPNMNILNFD